MCYKSSAYADFCLKLWDGNVAWRRGETLSTRDEDCGRLCSNHSVGLHVGENLGLKKSEILGDLPLATVASVSASRRGAL